MAKMQFQGISLVLVSVGSTSAIQFKCWFIEFNLYWFQWTVKSYVVEMPYQRISLVLVLVKSFVCLGISATSEAFPLCKETSLGEMLISSLNSKRVCRRIHESGLWVTSDCGCIVLDPQYFLSVLASHITLNPCSLSFPDCYSYWSRDLWSTEGKMCKSTVYLCLWHMNIFCTNI